MQMDAGFEALDCSMKLKGLLYCHDTSLPTSCTGHELSYGKNMHTCIYTCTCMYTKCTYMYMYMYMHITHDCSLY